MSSEQSTCYTLIAKSSLKSFTDKQLKADLEGSNIPAKITALKELIRCMSNGERIKDILMTVIRFVMPCNDHTIKKLLFVFWEIVPKCGPDGRLLHEMILVCDAYRKDLQHPNEFIRGCTLRFLCKLKEPELLEPLMPSIKQCLDHRHPYVRRNAVLAIYTIYKNFDFLFPGAPEAILQFLQQEADASCKRNAFIMLTHVNQSMAVEYLATCLDEVPDFDEILQLVVVELIYKVCHANPTERSRFIRSVYELLQSKSAAVRYEAASTLVTLSNAPSAVKAVAACYIELIMKESDNNVKLIVMDRLMSLRHLNDKIMQDLIMDVAQMMIASSDFELRMKALDFVLDLLTSRTANELATFLVKEMLRVFALQQGPASKSKDESTKVEQGEEAKYKFNLVHTLYETSLKFPSVLPLLIGPMCEVLTYEDSQEAANEVCRFLRETFKRNANDQTVKAQLFENLISTMASVSCREALCQILWIFGEFSHTKDEINNFMNLIRQSLGELPLVDNELRRVSDETSPQHTSEEKTVSSGPKVTADGTYATQSVFTTKSNEVSGALKRPVVQAALFDADYTPGVVLSVALVKLFARFRKLVNSEQLQNAFAGECMLTMSSMIHLAQSGLLAHFVNPDLLDRIWKCFRLLLDRSDQVMDSFPLVYAERLDQMLASQEAERKRTAQSRKRATSAVSTREKERNRVDAPISFSLLSSRTASKEAGMFLDMFDGTLNKALRESGPKLEEGVRKVHQLTGFSDPVYAEAYVNVNQFDIVLDILVVNQTSDTLQNLTLELNTLGDLKLVERPQAITLAPADFASIKANIKVSSTENGMIFGNIVYDVRGSSGECNVVVLSEIHIDILEYIQPATCTAAEFRKMWTEFEWENRVTVNTRISDLRLYLAHITKNTNFRCLTPVEAMAGECDYLCATLYAKSIFGEHVLANLCLELQGGEQHQQPVVTGHVRIRAKTQGMAITIGDKISLCHKQPVCPELLKEFGSISKLSNTNNNSTPMIANGFPRSELMYA